MLGVSEADSRLEGAFSRLAERAEPLLNCVDQVLRKDIVADRDQPPFDRVAMDGIALDFDALRSGRREYRVQSRQGAGHAPHVLLGSEHAIEIMTGAVLPLGTSCVVPVESLTFVEDRVVISRDVEPVLYQNVHRRGSDRLAGASIVPVGARLGGAQLGIAAACGLSHLTVSTDPAIKIFTTGDELVPLDQSEILPHQIRGSNGYAIAGLLHGFGFRRLELGHLPDDPESVERALAQALEVCDCVILTGGVSAGRYDYVPNALAALGVERLFHKLRQKPGKPLWMGRGGTGQVVAGLPGNPVAALVCLRRYVVPALLRRKGLSEGDRWLRPRSARLAETPPSRRAMTLFLPVRCVEESGITQAFAVPSNGSGDYGSLATCDGFVEVSEEHEGSLTGASLPVWMWRGG